jgi:hypothetical protein
VDKQRQYNLAVGTGRMIVTLVETFIVFHFVSAARRLANDYTIMSADLFPHIFSVIVVVIINPSCRVVHAAVAPVKNSFANETPRPASNH